MITVKELIESASEILQNKMSSMERMNTVRIPTPEERRRRIADNKKIGDENIKKHLDRLKEE